MPCNCGKNRQVARPSSSKPGSAPGGVLSNSTGNPAGNPFPNRPPVAGFNSPVTKVGPTMTKIGPHTTKFNPPILKSTPSYRPPVSMENSLSINQPNNQNNQSNNQPNNQLNNQPNNQLNNQNNQLEPVNRFSSGLPSLVSLSSPSPIGNSSNRPLIVGKPVSKLISASGGSSSPPRLSTSPNGLLTSTSGSLSPSRSLTPPGNSLVSSRSLTPPSGSSELSNLPKPIASRYQSSTPIMNETNLTSGSEQTSNSDSKNNIKIISTNDQVNTQFSFNPEHMKLPNPEDLEKLFPYGVPLPVILRKNSE